jgi:hypothetical protein
MAHPSHPPRLDYSNYTWRRVQITKLLVMQFPPVTSSLFGPNILLSTLFSNTLSLCSSLNYILYYVIYLTLQFIYLIIMYFRTILGQEEPAYNLAARYVTEQTQMTKPVLYSICLKDCSLRTLKAIKEVILQHKMW